MMVKTLSRFIESYTLNSDDDLIDDDGNQMIGICLGDSRGDFLSCGYLLGVGNTGLICYAGVNVPSLNLDLDEKRWRVKIIGVDIL